VIVRGLYEDSPPAIEVGGLSDVLDQAIKKMDDPMFLRFCKVAEASLVKHPAGINRLLILDAAACKEILLRNAARIPLNRQDYLKVIPSDWVEAIRAKQTSCEDSLATQ
jgi:hypothetical protein